MPNRLLAIAALALIAAGCGGARPAAHASKPAWAALAAPRGYHVQHVWQENLTGGPVPDVVVTSEGRPRVLNGLPGRPSDLRVLVWNARALRWKVAFDAQKVVPVAPCSPATGPNTCSALSYAGVPLLDPQSVDWTGRVRFAPLVSPRRDDLVFAADTASATASPVTLAVVDFDHDYPSLVYTWSGRHGLRWHVANRHIYGKAGDYRYGYAECCPVREYRFAVALRGGFGGFVETSDDRAWLGVTIKYSGSSNTVVGIDTGSPAGKALRLGDRLLKVLGTPKSGWFPTFAQQLGRLYAGQIARLLVNRDGRRIVVRVRLGSLKDAIPQLFPFNSRLEGL